jgi:hypothetical protein
MKRVAASQGSRIVLWLTALVLGLSPQAALADKYFGITACRFLDTRGSTQITGTPATKQVSGTCGIPADATMIAGNIAVVSPAASGYVSIYPAGISPATSTVNFNAGSTRANNFLIGLSAAGQISLVASSAIDVIVDLVGYTTPSASFVCPGGSGCRSALHTTQAQSSFPYGEDIGSGAVVQYVSPSGDYSHQITSTCSSLAGNLNAAQAANVLLRAYLRIDSTTLPDGALYAIQLQVDGVEHGWYSRRVNVAAIPYGEYFEGTIQNLAAGSHVFGMAVSVFVPGALTIGQTWITTQGSPSYYPSAKDVLSPQQPINTGWSQISRTLTFTNSSSLDVAIQGYFQIDSANAAENIWVGVSLDGAQIPASRQRMLGINTTLPTGFNILDYLSNVPPGNHSLSLYAHTTSASAALELAQLEFVSFPTNASFASGYPGGTSASVPLTVRSDTTATPGGSILNPLNGWTKLLEYDIPPVLKATNWTLEGYIQFLGAADGLPLSLPSGQVAFEALIPAGCTPNLLLCPNQDPSCYAVDLGYVYTAIPSGRAGLFLFGDGMLIGTNVGARLRLWIRSSGCPAGSDPCGVVVGNRDMTLRLTPFEGCFYN